MNAAVLAVPTVIGQPMSNAYFAAPKAMSLGWALSETSGIGRVRPLTLWAG